MFMISFSLSRTTITTHIIPYFDYNLIPHFKLSSSQHSNASHSFSFTVFRIHALSLPSLLCYIRRRFQSTIFYRISFVRRTVHESCRERIVQNTKMKDCINTTTDWSDYLFSRYRHFRYPIWYQLTDWLMDDDDRIEARSFTLLRNR